jgi:hypothetical protein
MVEELLHEERDAQIPALRQKIKTAARELKDLKFAKSEKKKSQIPKATSDLAALGSKMLEYLTLVQGLSSHSPHPVSSARQGRRKRARRH